MAIKQIKTEQPKKNIAARIVIGVSVIFLILIVGWMLVSANNQKLFNPAIAVIPIKGEIGIGGPADPQTISKLIEDAEKETTVKAIIFDINSPGGGVVASETIASAVKNAKKPTVAIIREVGASGAFWIATSADKVVADPASITGSIGVTASYLSFENLMQKYGITYNQLVTGQYKDIGSPYTQLTPNEKQYLLQKITILKNMFVYAIAQNRNLSVDYVDKLADGGVWLGTEAKDYGMVDVLGGGSDAQKLAEQLAGIENSRIVIMGQQSLFGATTGAAVNSAAYWAGKGIGSELISTASQQKLPDVTA